MLTSSALNIKNGHALSAELADSVAVDCSRCCGYFSVQLLFKSGRYSAYTCIDCQLYCTHTLLSQSLSTCCMNTSHIQRSRIKGTKDGVYFCMKIVLKCVCVNIWITLEVTPLLVLSTSSLNEMLHRLSATY